ncbi:MAG: glycosyltransferase family 2 protein [Myxococcales bacterium]|nr:glycosyltransferase family 2 protein [Myxococcales bacterium]
MMEPLVSILLPIHNAQTTLGPSLQSLQRKTLEAWECITVDDGSSDTSLALCRGFARSDPRIRVFDRPRRGIVPADPGCSRDRARGPGPSARSTPGGLGRWSERPPANPERTSGAGLRGAPRLCLRRLIRTRRSLERAGRESRRECSPCPS